MRCNVCDDPAVIAIACAVKISEAEVVGLLHRLWSWADQHTPDGFAANVGAAWVDRHVARKGFAAAMVSSNWLEIDGSGITFPHFERHNGKPAKRRAQDAKQKEWERNNGQREDVPPDKRLYKNRTNVGKMSSCEEDGLRTSAGLEVEVEVEKNATQPTVVPLKTPTSKTLVPGVKKRPPDTEQKNGKERETGKTLATRHAYGDAYRRRYGVEPTFNRKVNGELAHFVDRIGAEESPYVASHFVHSNRGLYVAAMHPTNLLLRDAEALRTEWATNRHGTETEARTADRTAANGNTFGLLIEEARNAER